MSSADRTYDEKRSFIRMKINTPVKVTAEGKDYAAIGKDLSGSGMLVLLDQELPVGSEVQVNIEQEKDRAPFRATAEVQRVHEKTEEGYLLGLKIVAIHD